MIVVIVLLTGCVHLLLSPRQQVVKSALEAMCDTKSMQSLAPYVTDDLRMLLAISDPLAIVLEKVGIFHLSDAIAAACHDADVKFASEIKVNDNRYLVRLSSKENKVLYEFSVIKERNDWKISSVKK